LSPIRYAVQRAGSVRCRSAIRKVLAGWAKVRLALGFPPHLLSFDSQTDLHCAFLRHLQLAWDSTELVERGDPLIRQIQVEDASTISTAIQLLASDEHIDCARRAGIIDRVFIFLGARTGRLQLPETTIFEDRWLPTCSKRTHDDDCLRTLVDHVLEPIVLGPRIDAVVTRIGKPLDQIPYILDIDLDVFRTRRAATPNDPRLFRQLVTHAKAITVACEPGWVERLWLGKEEIASDELEALVLDHI
jgi:hypothetical protein